MAAQQALDLLVLVRIQMGKQQKVCPCGGMVYTIDSKSVAARYEGSNPFKGTKEFK